MIWGSDMPTLVLTDEEYAELVYLVYRTTKRHSDAYGFLTPIQARLLEKFGIPYKKESVVIPELPPV